MRKIKSYLIVLVVVSIVIIMPYLLGDILSFCMSNLFLAKTFDSILIKYFIGVGLFAIIFLLFGLIAFGIEDYDNYNYHLEEKNKK